MNRALDREELPTSLRARCGHDSRSVEGCVCCQAADYIEQTSPVEAAVERDAWQPISTAPRDKRILCAWRGSPGFHEVDLALHYTDHLGEPYWASLHDLLHDRFCTPDLWQPVPEVTEGNFAAIDAQNKERSCANLEKNDG